MKILIIRENENERCSFTKYYENGCYFTATADNIEISECKSENEEETANKDKSSDEACSCKKRLQEENTRLKNRVEALETENSRLLAAILTESHKLRFTPETNSELLNNCCCCDNSTYN